MRTPYHFFLSHSGYSYDPKTETPMRGRIRCAQESARAESLFLDACRVADVGISWDDDPDGAQHWRACGEEFESCESATIWHRDDSGTVHYLASLGGITDADSNYRRVIRAELAQECADELRAILEA